MSVLTWFLHLLNRVDRLPHTAGPGKIFSAEQKAAIVNMIMANTVIGLCVIQTAVNADQGAFRKNNSVSLATIDQVLT